MSLKLLPAAILVAIIVTILWFFLPTPIGEPRTQEAFLSAFYTDLSQGEIERFDWQGRKIDAVKKDGTKMSVQAVDPDSPAGADLIRAAFRTQTDVRLLGQPASATLLSVISVIGFPLMIIALIYYLLIRPMHLTNRSRLEQEMRRVIDCLRPSGAETSTVDWQVGNEVKVLDGTFKGFRGKVVAVEPDRQCVKAMLEIFGRDTPVELHYDEIEKIA